MGMGRVCESDVGHPEFPLALSGLDFPKSVDLSRKRDEASRGVRRFLGSWCFCRVEEGSRGNFALREEEPRVAEWRLLVAIRHAQKMDMISPGVL